VSLPPRGAAKPVWCFVTRLHAKSLWRFRTCPTGRTCWAFRFWAWGMSSYLAESNGLNCNPDIYEKAGALIAICRHPDFKSGDHCPDPLRPRPSLPRQFAGDFHSAHWAAVGGRDALRTRIAAMFGVSGTLHGANARASRRRSTTRPVMFHCGATLMEPPRHIHPRRLRHEIRCQTPRVYHWEQSSPVGSYNSPRFRYRCAPGTGRRCHPCA
jgi:hypothetical protein